MASSDNELESQLMEGGSKLVDPPLSVDELLPLLDKIESCLQKVEQSPTMSMQNALSPSLKALVSEKLLRHSNIDVQVVVASCISEITRITAPDAPYDDDLMKEVFQLIVSSFENIDDNFSRSYAKRASILETVAKVRSCVVMLDLECDALIVQMFQHFLKAIRDHHPENIFSSMEIIMTLVLEESEDISLELLSLILATVKKDNKDVLPIARKLGERVLVSCAAKLKPYLLQAVEAKSISLNDYSKALASICQDAIDNGHNEVQATGEHKADETKTVEASGGEGDEEIKGVASETSPLGEVDHTVQECPLPVVDNGLKQTGENELLDDSKSLKKQEGDHPIESSEDLKSSNVEPDGLENENASYKEQESEQSIKGRGKKINDSLDDSNSLKEQNSDRPIENFEELRSSKAEPDVLEKENTSNNDQESEQSTKSRGKKITDSLDDSDSLKKQDYDYSIENSEDLKSSKAETDILENENTSKKVQESEQSTKRGEEKINDTWNNFNIQKKQDGDHPIENSEDLKSSMAEPDILENENTSNKEQEPEQSTKRSGKKINESLDDSNSLKQDGDHPIGKSEDLKSRKAEPGILGNENTSNRDKESEQSTKQRGRKSYAKSRATSNSSHAVYETESEKVPDKKCHGEDDPTSHCEGPSDELVVLSENNDESDTKQSSPEAMENESTDIASASPTRNHPDELHTKKAGRQKKKGCLVKDDVQTADDASKKVADRTGNSEVKPSKRSGKKLPSVSSNDKKTSTVGDASVMENIIVSDSEKKPSKQSAKKVGASNTKNDGSSSKHHVARKKQGTVKDLMEEDTPKAAVKDIKEIISSPKPAKSTKVENQLGVTPKKSAKRKRPPIKDDPDNAGCGEELVGSKIKVWWPADKQYYDGVVNSFDPVKRRHKVLYTDGEQEDLNLRRQRWEIIDPSEGEEETGRLSPQDSNEMPLKKKSKTNSDVKGGKFDASSKRSEGASSSKSKGTTGKSGGKSKEGIKVDGRSKDDSKSVRKSENETSGKSKDQTSRSGTNKSANVDKKTFSKSKKTENQASKEIISKDETRTPAKSKQDIEKVDKSTQGTSKTPSISKGKSPKSGVKTNVDGTGKVKSGSSKIKENEEVKENVSDSGKRQESTKEKSPKSLTGQGSEAKLGKKRKKGVKC